MGDIEYHFLPKALIYAKIVKSSYLWEGVSCRKANLNRNNIIQKGVTIYMQIKMILVLIVPFIDRFNLLGIGCGLLFGTSDDR